jgi:hypothetical protein
MCAFAAGSTAAHAARAAYGGTSSSSRTRPRSPSTPEQSRQSSADRLPYAEGAPPLTSAGFLQDYGTIVSPASTSHTGAVGRGAPSSWRQVDAAEFERGMLARQEQDALQAQACLQSESELEATAHPHLAGGWDQGLPAGWPPTYHPQETETGLYQLTYDADHESSDETSITQPTGDSSTVAEQATAGQATVVFLAVLGHPPPQAGTTAGEGAAAYVGQPCFHPSLFQGVLPVPPTRHRGAGRDPPSAPGSQSPHASSRRSGRDERAEMGNDRRVGRAHVRAPLGLVLTLNSCHPTKIRSGVRVALARIPRRTSAGHLLLATPPQPSWPSRLSPP